MNEIKLSEIEIQNSILELLHSHEIPAVRINNHAVFDSKNKKFRAKNKWEKKHGSPLDIFVFLPDGKNCWIEVKKSEKERPTPGQMEWIQTTIENGGIAFVAFSLRCVKDNLSGYLTR